MAAKKDDNAFDPMRRLSNIIAVVAFKDQKPDDAALRLETLGFTAKEIGGILGKNENYIHMVKSDRKSSKGASRGKKAKD